MKKFKFLIFSLLLALVLTGCGATDESAPVFGVFLDRTVEYGSDFDPMEGVTATDDVDGNLSSLIECDMYDPAGDMAFDTSVTGVYTQICTVSDEAGNTVNVERTITVLDEEIGAVFGGVEDVLIPLNGFFDPLNGLEIVDKKDGFITEDVLITIYDASSMGIVQEIDTSTLGTYYVDYSITNSLDIVSELRISVSVIDAIGPVITAEDFWVDGADSYDLLENISAFDAYDGIIDDIEYTVYDLDNNVVEDLSDLLGAYVIEYSAEDESGNVTTKQVNVFVADLFIPEVTVLDYHYVLESPESLNLDDNLLIYDETDDIFEIEYEFRDFNTMESIDDVTLSSRGTYYVVAKVKDAIGNEGSNAFYLTITDSGLVNLDLTDQEAENYLENFYQSSDFFEPELVCNLYMGNHGLGEINSTNCVAGLYDFLSNVNAMWTVSTSSYIADDVKYYTTEMDYSISAGHLYKDVTYRLVGYEDAPYVYIVFESNPFDFEYPITVTDISYLDVESSLNSFYFNLFWDNRTPTEACEMLISDAPYYTMTVSECVTYVNNQRALDIDVDILDYVPKSIDVGDITYDGYEVTIQISKIGFSQEATVDAVLLTQRGVNYIYFPDGFLGLEYVPNITILEYPEIHMITYVSEFYDNLLNDVVPPEDFCTEYMLANPLFDYNLDGCVDYVNHIRQFDISYTIQSITPTTDNGLGGTFDAYTLEIIFDDGTGNGTVTAFYNFVITLMNSDVYPIFFNAEVIDLSYEQELLFITSTSTRFYSGYISSFYTDVLDDNMSHLEFYNKYLLTGDNNVPLTYSEFVAIRNDIDKFATFDISDQYYDNTGAPGVSPTYYVKIGDNPLTRYTVPFYFYTDIFGELVIRVNFDDALGN